MFKGKIVTMWTWAFMPTFISGKNWWNPSEEDNKQQSLYGKFYFSTYQRFSCWIFLFTWLHLHELLFAFPLKLILIMPLSCLLLFSYRAALMANRVTFNQMKLQVWVLTMDCRINSDVTHWSARSCLFTSYASWTNQKIDLPTSWLCWLDEFTSSGSFLGGVL